MSDNGGPLDGVIIMLQEDVPEGTTFEDAMTELERCVDALEAGEVGIEEALVLFRRGAALEAWCATRLDAISASIEELTADGAPADPFDGDAG